MQLTRHGWATVGLIAGLAVFAVALRSWLLLAGVALLGAWVLTRGVLFVAALSAFDTALSIDQELPSTVRPDIAVPLTLSAHLARPTPLDVQITARPPVVADSPTVDRRSIRLSPGEREVATTFRVTFLSAGVATVEAPRINVTDGQLFTEDFSRGDCHRVVVQPRVPDDIHVGQGGQQFAVGYGEHEALRPKGGGVEPDSIREYTPSDSVRQIDWKATARLQTPQIREYQAETDRESMLVVDHRASTAVGQPGQTAHDYLREVALAFVERADRVDDPLGCFTIGDGGVTGRFPIAATEPGYNKIQRHLSTLSPTQTTDIDDSTTQPGQGRTPAAARRAANTLADASGDAFAETLWPFFEASDRYVTRFDNDPLFGATRRATRTAVHTVIFTTDTNRATIRETVRLARRGDRLVTVFLAPCSLFERGGLSDLESAYNTYLDFEEFRRSLARLDRVDVYEVAPGSRLAAVLDQRRSRRGAVP